jgi:Zn-dependent protease with chaperone function
MQNITYEINKKEKFYYGFSLIISLILYYVLLKNSEFLIYLIPYVIYIVIFVFFSQVILVGHLRGNAVEVTKDQFPEIYQIANKQSLALKLKKPPKIYLLQGGGMLNAFATKFLSNNYVIIYSDIFEMAYDEGIKAVEFVIAHELGHIKRRHVGLFNTLILLPSYIIPFLYFAHSRAKEYTCDNIGCFLSPKGATKGILILASGKKLYKKIDEQSYIKNYDKSTGFVTWFSEIFSTHPHLVKRLKNISKINKDSN